MWINGGLTPASEARVSPLDRGFTVGWAAFETLRARAGVPFAVTRHWKRLVESCRILRIQPPFHSVFLDAIMLTLEANHLREARVRFSVTAGEGAGAKDSSPTFVAYAVPLQPYARNEKVITVPWRQNARSATTGTKCASYAANMLALAHAHERGAGEAVLANTRGRLCEGATSNIFLTRRGRTVTPSLSSGCLPGIARGLVLELARAHGVPVEETDVSMSALRDAEEAFLTSSLRGVQPVASVDGKKFPHIPGGTTRRLARLYQDLVKTNPDP